MAEVEESELTTQPKEEASTREREIVAEFCHLIEHSRQLFKGLRDLPQFGHKSWQTQFGKTFDVYTKLWKFQQENRLVLDKRYDLKRWQIGEIASKIGQLYYHYYLRTSESNYLAEAFSFYTAIRSRAYYSNASKFEKSDLMVKKLRYYARFIVVTLLLNKMDFVKELAKELRQYVDEYAMVYDVTTDEGDWRLVINEVTTFIESDSLVTVRNPDITARILSHRLDTEKSLSDNQGSTLSLQEIIIVGNSEKQVKFSELTLDMFRMLQALEREPEEYQPYTLDNSVDFTGNQMRKETTSSKKPNPHKYLLYKPTFSQLFTFLASGFKELPHNAVMLIYLSADSNAVECNVDGPYGQGGVRMSCHKVPANTTSKKGPQSNVNEPNTIYPDDLMPFTRKALMVIVDSKSSTAFKSLSSTFGQPVVSLMSPNQVPHTLQDVSHKGSLFTLFLYNSLVALLYICNITNCQNEMWDKCSQQMKEFELDLTRLFNNLSKLIGDFIFPAVLLIQLVFSDVSYLQLTGDEFLTLMIHRFIFCYYVTRQHKAFKGEEYFPCCSPSLPTQLLENTDLRKRILALTSTLDVRGLFYEVEDIPL